MLAVSPGLLMTAGAVRGGDSDFLAHRLSIRVCGLLWAQKWRWRPVARSLGNGRTVMSKRKTSLVEASALLMTEYVHDAAGYLRDLLRT